jgi:MFS transporter, SHS family, lactate transporter
MLLQQCKLKNLQVLFGIISDRFGRKWPLVVNLVLCSVLQLGSGFVQTFHQFLAVRSLFGIAMGGIWGLAAATALENLPVELRGLGSGVIQQSYSVGCIIAAAINLTLVPETSTTWRSLFWCASGISLFAAFIRALLPDSPVFLRAKEIEKERRITTMSATKTFLREAKMMLARHWLLFIYAVVLMTGERLIKLGWG